MLTRDEILAARALLRRETVDVPGLGGQVAVWELTARERDSFDHETREAAKRGELYDNFRARLLVRALRDSNGERLFADGDVELLGSIPSAPIVELYEVAARLSLVTPQDIEELRKNSSGGPNGGSRSGSPTVSG